MSPVTRWQEHPPGCDCAPCERRQAAIAMNRAYLRQLAEAETEEEQERLLSRAEAAGRFLQAIAGPFSVLAVDTPSSREAERQRAEYEASPQSVIDALCEFDTWMLAGGVWKNEPPEPAAADSPPPEVPQAEPVPPRDRESRGWHRTHAQLTVDSFLLGMGLVFIIVGSHLVPWLGIPGLFCLIWAALPWKRWRP